MKIVRVIAWLILLVSTGTLHAQSNQQPVAANSSPAQTSDSGANGGDSNNQDITAVVAAANVTPPQNFEALIETLRQIATIILLIAVCGAAIAAANGNQKVALAVVGGAVMLFGAFWVVTMIAEGMSAPTSSDISGLKAYSAPNVSGVDSTYGPAGPIKAALNSGLAILTTFSLPFILIYGAWLSLAITVGEADQSVMKGYFVGAAIALSANILGQVFMIF